MELVPIACWSIILLLIWTGIIRKSTALVVSIILSTIPLILNFVGVFQNTTFVSSQYFFISPALLLSSFYVFSKTYQYLYGMKADPGITYSNRAKFSNRKLNIGDYIVSICPIIISLIPVMLKVN